MGLFRSASRLLAGPARPRFASLVLLCLTCSAAPAITNAVPDRGPLVFHPVPDFHAAFGGALERRITANRESWLLPAPVANPGMLEMFRVRDRHPVPQLVPWAGEFAGKYLISAVQALRLGEDARLRRHITQFVADLLATQDADGYLGPFPKRERLLGQWDLWGHYHVMQGLLLWHETSRDPAALRATERIGELICATYLDQNRRVFDAGSHEMNMAVIHGLGMLHRRTGHARYLRQMREIEKDWERAGDYLRAGLAGVEFHASPRPRWESLHDLQGLLELWRITGDLRYRTAFVHQWRSIARWDRHNHGGFSSGEQATGNAYSPGAIETCCTIAWMALSVDMLQLSGDPRVADELELATLNGALGAQHPSGRWWTYNTPMDGAREASAHTIVFQARAGTPELNCCSVNGPRALGLLSEWAVLTGSNGLVINWHGPAQYDLKLPSGQTVRLECRGDYPLEGRVQWIVHPSAISHPLPILFRIPAWASNSVARLNQKPLPVAAGEYLVCEQVWQEGDTVQLEFPLPLRAVTGDREAAGQVSLYRGPLLLAFDPRHNTFDELGLPAIDLDRISQARVLQVQPDHVLAPWLIVELPGSPPVRLCDFASAGVTGTRYRSWLPAAHAPPPPPITRSPPDGATIGPGTTTLRWTTRTNAALREYTVQVSASDRFLDPVIELGAVTVSRAALEDALKRRLEPQKWYSWRVIAQGPHGQTCSVEPTARFRYDPTQPSTPPEPESALGPGNLVLTVPLHGTAQPEFGQLKRATSFTPAAGPHGLTPGAVRLNGSDQTLVYGLPEELEDAYSVAVWVRVLALPVGRIGQIFSAWAAGMDDPLRLTVDQGKLFGRIEARQSYSTKGVPFEVGKWLHVAAVKSGTNLTVWVDGQPRAEIAVPALIQTTARSCALGGNPNYSGNEYLSADFAEFRMWLRAITAAEINEMRAARP